MRRVISYTLACWLVLLGTGWVQYLHNLEHALGQSATQVATDRGHAPRSIPSKHDDAKCQLCLQLHQPVWHGGSIIVSLAAASLVGRTEAAPNQWFGSRRLNWIDCRGPPARSALI